MSASPPSQGPDHAAPTPVVTVRLYGDLAFFAPEAARDLDVPFGTPRSVKDLLESLGVPDPEIDLIVVSGQPVGFDHTVAAGDRVAAYPPSGLAHQSSTRLPPPAARFVADVHLGTLARRLRVSGLDCVYDTEADDEWPARMSTAQDRVLLTRDRGLLMRREVRYGYCPRSDDPDVQLLEVALRFLDEDDLAPFTRCPSCGAALTPADKASVVDEIGPHTRATHDTFSRCTGCGSVYWPGSHTTALDQVVAGVRTALRNRGTTA